MHPGSRALTLVACSLLTLAGCLAPASTEPPLDIPPVAASNVSAEAVGSDPRAPAPAEDEDAPEGNATAPEPAATATEGAQDPEPEARVVTTLLNGTITQLAVGVGTADTGVAAYGPIVNGENAEGALRVDAARASRLTGLVFELHWDHDVVDLDFFVTAPDHVMKATPELNGTELDAADGHGWFHREGMAGSPNHPVIVRVTDPALLALEGEWAWEVNSKGAVDVAFTVAVTTFEGAAVPPAFTAVPT